MFGNRYFGIRFFPDRYFGTVSTEAPPTPSFGAGQDGRYRYRYRY